jgi:DNA-directed RNA polymerase specialized sigma24 family protein
MSDHSGSGGSVTFWLDCLRRGDETAAGLLWDRYFDRLVRLAGGKLRRVGQPGADADAEEAALSAFASFCTRARQGQYPALKDRDAFRRLLVVITLRKAADRINLRLRQKRGGGQVLGEVDLPRIDSEGARLLLDDLSGPQPNPELAAIFAEGVERLLQSLEDDTLRTIALGKLAGSTDQELAEQLGCSRRTITNKLKLIRLTWEDEQ